MFELSLTDSKNKIDNHLCRSYRDCNWGENREDYDFEVLSYLKKFNGKLLEFEDDIGGVFVYDMKQFNSISIGCLWINESHRGRRLNELIFDRLHLMNNRLYFFCLENLLYFYKRKNFQEFYLKEHNCYLMSNYKITVESDLSIF
jgi:hypothetical protein